MFSPSSIITGGLGSWGDIGSVITLGYGSGEYVPPVVDEVISAGNGFKKYPEKKRKIRLVRRLSKELKEVEEKLKVIEKQAQTDTSALKKVTELKIYEKLVYDDLINEFDETVKTVINAIERDKTEQLIANARITAEKKKQAQLIEEQDVIFAFMALM